MKKLKLIFLTSLGRKQTFTPKIADENLTPEKADELMMRLSQLGAFEKEDGTKLFAEVHSAKYVITTEVDLFDHQDDGTLQARRRNPEMRFTA